MKTADELAFVGTVIAAVGLGIVVAITLGLAVVARRLLLIHDAIVRIAYALESRQK